MTIVHIYAITIFLLFALIVFKKMNNRYQEEVFKRKLFRLRDELRWLGIRRQVFANCPEFAYLDTTLTKHLEQSYFISILYIWVLERRHKKKLQNLDAYKEEFEATKQAIEANELLNDIFVRKNKITSDYIYGQNMIVAFLSGLAERIAHTKSQAIQGVNRMATNVYSFEKSVREIIAEANYLPELSGNPLLA